MGVSVSACIGPVLALLAELTSLLCGGNIDTDLLRHALVACGGAGRAAWPSAWHALCLTLAPPRAAAWWAALACVYIPVADAGARGGMGVFSADLGGGGCRDPAVIAFQARRDAEAAAWAWAAATQAPEGPQRCAPRPPYPARLRERATVRPDADGVRLPAGCTCCRLRSCARPQRPRAAAWWCSPRGSCRSGRACPPRSWPACLCCTAGTAERPARAAAQQIGLWSLGGVLVGVHAHMRMCSRCRY